MNARQQRRQQKIARFVDGHAVIDQADELLIQVRDRLLALGGNHAQAFRTFKARSRTEGHTISLTEFKRGVKAMGLNVDPDVCETVFEGMDANKDKRVEFEEFFRQVLKTVTTS